MVRNVHAATAFLILPIIVNFAARRPFPTLSKLDLWISELAQLFSKLDLWINGLARICNVGCG